MNETMSTSALAFDFASAVQKPIIPPHWFYEDRYTNQCLVIVAGPDFETFLLNVACYDDFMARPTTGRKFLRFQGGRQNLDKMLPVEATPIDRNDIFNIGTRGPAYRIRFGVGGPSTFKPPVDFDPGY